MTERADNDDAVKALQRMIAYVQAEARRLGVMDVALLLEHAAEAVVEFAPESPPDRERLAPGGDRGLHEH